MKKLKTLFALLVLSFFTIGQVWATDVTDEFTSSSFSPTSTTYAATTIAGTATSSGTAYSAFTNLAGTSDFGIRGYNKTKSGTETYSGIISTSTEGNLKSVKVTINTGSTVNRKVYIYGKTSAYTSINDLFGDNKGTLIEEITYTSGTTEYTVTVPSNSSYQYVGITTNNALVRFDKIEITWATGSGSPDPAVSAKPASLDFGTVKQHASVAAKTFKFKGANLTANVNLTAPDGYSIGETTSFTAEQAMAADSVQITVTPSTETAGSFNGNLTIASAKATPEFTTVNVALSMTVTPTYAVAVAVNDGEMGSATINGVASVYGDENDTELALVATPKSGYEFVNWEVTSGSADDIEISSPTSASTTAGLVTGAVTITANFQAQSCTNLAAPTLDEITKTYNSATIAWNTVDNADGYVLNVTKHEDGSAVVTDSVFVDPAVSCEIDGLDAETQYDFTVMALGDGTTYCDANNPLLESNFTTEALPSATLTLSENGVTRIWGADTLKVTSKIALPTAVAAGNEIAGKVLVGWSADAERATAPELAKGAKFTMTATSHTLYAVYAVETPGATSLTKMVKGNTLSNGDKLVIVASGTKYGLYQEDNGSSYVKNWSFTGDDPVVSDLKDAKKIWDVSTGSTSGKWKLGDATNGYLNNASSTNLTVDATGSDWTLGDLGDGTFNLTSAQKLSCRTDLTTGNANLWRGAGSGGTSGTPELLLYKYTAEPSTFSGYTTIGAKAPKATITGGTSVEIAGTAKADGSIAVQYANVAIANVKVATFENAACSDTLDAGWLVASLTNETKQIAYTAAANTSYANTRSAYIQLVAPSPADGVAADTAVITVTQAANPNRVFASLEALAASDVPAGDSVTVTLTKEVINSLYYWNSNLSGLNLATTKDDANIRIYYTTGVSTIEDWEANGSVSGVIRAQWTTYNSVWQLKPASTWKWTDLTYKDPTATGVDNTEAGVKAVKVLREGQIFILRDGKEYNVQGQLVK